MRFGEQDIEFVGIGESSNAARLPTKLAMRIRVWRKRLMTELTFIAVAKSDEIPPDSVKEVHAGGESILLCNSEDRIFAIVNRCSHAEEPLACGRVRYGWIACPMHGARFELETGEAMNPPAKDPIRTFPVRVVEGVIEIAV